MDSFSSQLNAVLVDTFNNILKFEEDLLKQSKFSNTDDMSLDENTLICIDALDELPFEKLYAFMEMIESFIHQNPLTKLFVSCRTHHLKKMDAHGIHHKKESHHWANHANQKVY